MKKIGAVLVLSILLLIKPLILYPAQSNQELTSNQGTSVEEQAEPTAQLEMAASGKAHRLTEDRGDSPGPLISIEVDGVVVTLAMGGMQRGSDESDEKPMKLARLGENGELDTKEPLKESIPDPLEPLNRAFFHFNDKLYFWLLKPVATGYKAVVPQGVRVGVRDFFYNLAFPVRFINCLLQAKFEGAGIEFIHFLVNTTAGMGGFVDVASHSPTLKEQKKYEEDLGQTLGSYGIGHGFYINWPILGPSSLRDTFGLVGDGFLDPTNYAVPRTKYNVSVKSYNGVNKTSLTIGDYEDLKKAALDPYVSLRDAYYQYRKKKVKE
ncbi:MAG: VacJ family lipoprotein [Pseudomonadota bacterium]